jgi:hypothetical protein
VEIAAHGYTDCPRRDQIDRLVHIIDGNGEAGLKAHVETLMADRDEAILERRESRKSRRNMLATLIAGFILALLGEGLIYVRPQPQIISTTQSGQTGDSTRTTVGK